MEPGICATAIQNKEKSAERELMEYLERVSLIRLFGFNLDSELMEIGGRRVVPRDDGSGCKDGR